ncbi:hypothetical protein DIE03_17565 [Burkholderia sp. Bp8992]|uniref:hypothetical protein n=1 Tax=unclassified Burkholderia TaxID=2613784 RepID=UPI000F55B9B9|nr:MULTISPECIES: hypothetical protein [unclassified Burkholderia]RQS28889.1 hypothetical protein DIE03_17565 [Burkholderia sp. Bp8992]
MNAASNARQANDAGATDTRRRDGQRTVTPTRTRARATTATSRDTRRSTARGASGPVAARDGDGKGKPLWEDDSGATPPEEWS